MGSKTRNRRLIKSLRCESNRRSWTVSRHTRTHSKRPAGVSYKQLDALQGLGRTALLQKSAATESSVFLQSMRKGVGHRATLGAAEAMACCL